MTAEELPANLRHLHMSGAGKRLKFRGGGAVKIALAACAFTAREGLNLGRGIGHYR